MGMTLVPSRPTKCVRGRLCVCVMAQFQALSPLKSACFLAKNVY